MNYDIEYQKKLREVFNALKEKNEVLEAKQVKLGYQQRNELISHVYSGYNNDEKLLSKKCEWESVGLEQRTVNWIYNLMRSKRDLYGDFEKPEEILAELKNLIKLSEEKELFEIASILNYWRLQLVER
ncbi:hypothetical protein JJL45_13155 [Tamlana sp. s12]|uniref:hypothetical protein n=1 Tax=Tamlana sp. s12 TaxID=1630406 RepID=UPI000801FABC|nr:hypothetical protein [Tamlana sp. s12]OBQ56516.1 hypothetical protein VQ01_03950 [Tamlana sp. s12]QQY81857.1 hypothetical protein JJL45_13155 [Tamlana sp. s12]